MGRKNFETDRNPQFPLTMGISRVLGYGSVRDIAAEKVSQQKQNGPGGATIFSTLAWRWQNEIMRTQRKTPQLIFIFGYINAGFIFGSA